MPKFNLNIIGAGAIGHLWHCFLSFHQISSQLYSRSAKAQQNIQVVSPLGNFSQQVEYRQLDSWLSCDFILICVKAQNLETLCQQLTKLEMKNSPIILMMNGLGLVEIVEHYLPYNPVIHASVIQGVALDDNKLFHTGQGQTLLGNLTIQHDSRDYSHLIQKLNQVLPTVEWSQQHHNSMNLKILVNAVINPVTALLGVTNGKLIQGECLIDAAESLLCELKPLLPSLVPELNIDKLRKIIIQVINKTASNYSSMLKDVQLNRSTEIDFINGYLVNYAAEMSVVLPLHEQMIIQIKKLLKQI